MRQSRSISPNLRPPPRALPSVGCFVSIWTCPLRPRVDLVRDHVVQLLVVDDADEDVDRELLPGLAVVEYLPARRLETVLLEDVLELLGLLSGEPGAVRRDSP